MKAIEHFKTITRHKYLVMVHCFKIGLYRQGLLHDLSKYSPTEFLVGCRYYQGNRSPNNAEREATGYSMSWLHHKGRNKHHYEYWIDYSPVPGEGIIGLEMPIEYIAEMAMDRIAACKIYMGDSYTDQAPLAYFDRGAGKLGKMIHPNTERYLRDMLLVLAEHGEDYAFRYIKKKYLRKGRKNSTIKKKKKSVDNPDSQ